MKRFFALTLVLMMLMLLVACGTAGPNASEPVGNVTEAEGTAEAPAPEETPEVPEETPEAPEDAPEAPEEPETDAPAFDTSWASNDFEAMIPELPFTGWTVTEESDSSRKLELGRLKTANGADTASGFEEDKDTLITYLGTLPTYGFTVDETGEGYKWLVTDENGNTIEFTCSDGFCWVKFMKAA